MNNEFGLRIYSNKPYNVEIESIIISFSNDKMERSLSCAILLMLLIILIGSAICRAKQFNNY